jgi:hypothetical protein
MGFSFPFVLEARHIGQRFDRHDQVEGVASRWLHEMHGNGDHCGRMKEGISAVYSGQDPRARPRRFTLAQALAQSTIPTLQVMFRLLGLLALCTFASAAEIATLGIKSPRYTVTSPDGAQLASSTCVYFMSLEDRRS